MAKVWFSGHVKTLVFLLLSLGEEFELCDRLHGARQNTWWWKGNQISICIKTQHPTQQWKKTASQHHIQNNPQRTAMSPLTVIISLTNKSLKDEVFEANANIRNAVGNFQTLNSLQRQKSKRIKYIFKVHRN